MSDAVTSVVAAALESAAQQLPFQDTRDFDAARRGLVVDWVVDGLRPRLQLSNGVLVHHPANEHDTTPAYATVTSDQVTFVQSAFTPQSIGDLAQAGRLVVDLGVVRPFRQARRAGPGVQHRAPLTASRGHREAA